MPTLRRVLAGRAPRSIVEVIARLEAIEAALPSVDGVAWFTRLYLAVTREVHAGQKPRRFKEPAFVERLDVVFANLYFSALEALTVARGSAPHAWVPLWADRSQPRIAPIQFALCGMNAHINRDLPVALVQTTRELGIELRHASPEHADFTSLNAVLERTEAKVKKQFATGIVGVADELLGEVDDRIAMWKVGRAREAAWVQGEILASLGDAPLLSKRYLDTLDRTVGFAGRGLLVPL